MSRLRAIVVGVGGGIALAAGLTMTMDAQAVCCDPWGVPGANAFVAAGTEVVGSITSAVSTIVNTVETGALYSFTQGVGKATGEYAKQSASTRVLLKGHIAEQAKMALDEKVAEAAEAAVEPAMLDETIPNALLVGEGQQATAQIVRRYDAQLAARMVQSPDSDTNALVDRHLARYCNYQNAAAGICQSQAADDMQDADATVATIYGGTSLTYSDEQRDAALAAVELIIVPDPLHTLSAAQRSTQDNEHDAYLLADQAALSLAAHVLHAQVADRTRKRDTP